MICYYQGCNKNASTKEHIPPKSFFPKNLRNQLVTVHSCDEHNTHKSGDDVYALAQICLNASPQNQSRSIFRKSIVPQLPYNEDALRKRLTRSALPLQNGAVAYSVEEERIDNFFNALSCGIIYHIAREQLPKNYKMIHVYHNFSCLKTDEEINAEKDLVNLYDSDVSKSETFNFGEAKLYNKEIYDARVIGIKGFQSNITIIHTFFEVFKVTTLLGRQLKRK